MKDSLPSDVRRFILDHIGSVEMLNVLLLLHQHRERDWTAEEVGRESRTNEWSAELQLQALAERALVAVSGDQPPRYRFDARFVPIVGGVARTFQERRVAVVTLIYSRPDDADPEPPDPVEAFADAFKLRKDK